MLLLSFDLHYIENENKYKRGIHPISPENLSSQIDKIGEHFSFISQNDLMDAIIGNSTLPERSCLITFDDGIRCQYENALPILKKKGIPAIFFVSSLPYVEKRACLVHKIHWVRSILSESDFVKKINEKVFLFLNKSTDEILTDDIKKQAKYKYRYDNNREAEIKFLLNYVLEEEIKEKIINNIFKEIVDDEVEFINNFYLTEKQICSLYDLGFLGLHSYSHRSLANLNKLEIEKEIIQNKNHLEGLVNGKIESISYPFGNNYDINNDVVNISKKLGIKIGFTKERSFNSTLENPLLIARADTNDVIGGKNPLFEIKDNSVIIKGNFGLKRSLFFQE